MKEIAHCDLYSVLSLGTCSDQCLALWTLILTVDGMSLVPAIVLFP